MSRKVLLFALAFSLASWPCFLPAQPLDVSGLDDLISPPGASTTPPPAESVSLPASAESASTSGAPEATSVPASPDTPEKTAGTTQPKKSKKGFFGIVRAGGPIGYIIILLSLVSVALMIEHALTIRRKVLMPPGFAEEILSLLVQGQLGPAIRKCQDNPSALGQVLYAAMSEYELGWNAVEKGAEEAVAEQASRFYRKVEYLNVIGNIAPMLGLLGTVVGMVFAFQQLAESEGYARAADLAEGIYLALVTTVQGLIVAIPSLAVYSIFCNRIALLIAETTYVAEQVLHPIKKSFVKKARS